MGCVKRGALFFSIVSNEIFNFLKKTHLIETVY